MKNPYRDFSNINPEIENGHRRIPNSVFRALIAAGLSGAEYQLVFATIDKTWGWGKGEDSISVSQFAVVTGLDRGQIHRCLGALEEKRILVVAHTGAGRGHLNTYMFNMFWDTWRVNVDLASTINQEILSDDQQSSEETLTDGQQSKPNVDSATTIGETLTPSQQLASNVDAQSTIPQEPNVDAQSTKEAGIVDKSKGIVDKPLVGNVDSQSTTKERKKDTKEKVSIKKKIYGEAQNVHLADDELTKLEQRFGVAGTRQRIEGLSLYKASRGKKYASDYATILNWERRHEGEHDGPRQQPRESRGDSGPGTAPPARRIEHIRSGPDDE